VQNNRLGIRQRWQLTDKAVARIRDAFRLSERAVKLDTLADVDKRFGSPAVGGQRDALYERLRPLMATDRSTGFDTHDLRAVAGAFLFEHTLGTTALDRAAPLITILACLQANSSVPAPGDPVWQEVVTIGRALVVLGAFLKHDPRHETVAAAIGRLRVAGYKVSVKYGRPWMSASQLAKATSKISELWDPIGLTTVFIQLADQMSRDCVYDFAQLDVLLPHFVHATGQVNASYASPLAAQSANLMFKPMIEGRDGTFVVPLASLAGPAFYEAAVTAMRPVLSKPEVKYLAGDGTERVILAMFHLAGLSPTFVGAKYNVNKPDAGECDLVFESGTHVVFLECKAKALTRAAMAGAPGAALEVYVAGVLNAQSQCLRHERLLRTNGRIVFEDGRRLDIQDREIVRLSVTLLDHGTMHDDKFFWTLADTLRRSRKAKLKAVMSKIDDELAKLAAIGRPASKSLLDAAFLSVGQLSTVLVGVTDLTDFAKRINSRVTTNSGNPLLEYHYNRSRTVP
jgi:hypothetical protein